MKKFNIFITIYLFMFLLSTKVTIAQTDRGEDTKLNMPHNWGIKPIEKVKPVIKKNVNSIPLNLLEQYKNAKLSRNDAEKLRIGKELQNYLPQCPTVIVRPEDESFSIDDQPPFEPYWLTNDVQIYSGSIAYAGGFRQIDLKRGEDGWLYLAVNRRNVTGYNGAVTVYRSGDGGATWNWVKSVVNANSYFGCISMLVEKRHATLDDSVRILLFYNRSSNSNFNDASLECASFRRDGSAFYVNCFAVPASGNKYEYPSACSDGMYYTTATYMHLVAREVTNNGESIGLRHFLSTDWGVTYTNVLIMTEYTDMYPSIAYSEKLSGTDSIYIAVERRISSTDYEIRVIVTSEWLADEYFTYFLTNGGTYKYEKPCITIQQQHYSLPRRIMVTCTKDNLPKYHASTNGGLTWGIDYFLGNYNHYSAYTSCSSDSLTASGGDVIGCYVSRGGDSITVRRGVLGNLGPYILKRNSNPASTLIMPVCAIHKSGTSKYSAFAYAGYGPTNVYFNQESLLSWAAPKNIAPAPYTLSKNYPNPFNPVTTISFRIPKKEFVTLKVYGVLGNEIATLVNEQQEAGTYNVSWNASNNSSGIYFYKLTAGNFVETKRMILVK